MKSSRNIKIGLDISIIIAACLIVLGAWYYHLSDGMLQLSMVIALLVSGVAVIDLFKQSGKTKEHSTALKEQAATGLAAQELILLNEDDKPVRAWGLAGKTALVIGRRNRDEEVDIDLSDCEYSALISVQHAVLNYCLDTWYLEDIGSQNGIQIKKVDDGRCYQVASGRPCKISAGDVIYIAKTKLLFT